MDKRKIIIVDRTSFLRTALKNTLLSIGNVEIIAEASTGKEFISILENQKPDIVFIDSTIKDMNGLEAIKLARAKYENTVIIGFSSTDTQCYVRQIAKAGANGFLSKCKNNYDNLCNIIQNPNHKCFYSGNGEPESKIAS